MSPLAISLLSSLVLIQFVMFCLWIFATLRSEASIVDSFWGTGFILVGWFSSYLNWPVNARTLLLLGLLTVWGVRLSVFLTWRNWGQGEDHRYAAMRKHHGSRFWWVSMFTVFLLQGAILWFVSLPIQVVVAKCGGAPLGWLDAVGAALWSVGLAFESIGDWQLARFRAQPTNAGRVLDRGLWRYTRHPNYFGDFCVWWGLYLIAAAGGGGWTIGSPLLMSLLLLKVSGVTLLEGTIRDRRPEYAAYQARTNAFFPGPPCR